MTVFLPTQPDVAPWEVVLRDLHGDEEAGKKKFAHIQRAGRNRAGFIIGGWDKEGNLRWWYAGGMYDPWTEFDKRISQTPWVYARLRDALNRIEWLRNLCRSSDAERYKYTSKRVVHVGLVYWVHPDAYDQPLDQYVRLTEGARYPGSPRQ